MALRALSLSFLTYANFGQSYLDACRLLGLKPTPSGYGFLHCVDEDGERVTRVTDDIAYARIIASRVGTPTLERLEVPATKFPVTLQGWPDDWFDRHEGCTTDAAEDAGAPDPHALDRDPDQAPVGGDHRRETQGCDLTARIRAICGSWPEVTERQSHGAPAFFVKKQFVMLWPDGHHDHRFPHLWCAAPPGAQEAMVETQPDRYFRPPYVGHRGWLGLRLDGPVDWEDVRARCADAYRSVAPKRLATLLPDDPGTVP